MNVLSFIPLAALATAQTLAPPLTVPHGASKNIDPSFPSFAIQGSSFPAYTGNASHPNIFSRNLIQGIQHRTCAALVVRVGGTNTDYSNYNPDQEAPITPPQSGAGIGQKFVFGPTFYEGFKNWPGTRWIYDVPFAKLNHTLSLDQAKAAVDSIGLQNLEALELGNEVDLYTNPKQNVRNSSWSPAEYADQFHTYSDWLVNALKLPNGPLFEVLTLSSAHPGAQWTAENTFKAGITNGGRVKSVSLHHYENTDTSTPTATLMNHTFVKAGVDTYASDIEYMQSAYPNVPIIFGESGRYTTNGSSTDDTEGIFGAGLWTADYLLYLMTQNVTRVNMQLGQVFGYVAWHPIAFDGLTPGVRSPYFGHLLAAEFIGCSKDFRVAEVHTGDEKLAVYAGYEHGKLVRLVIINYDFWTGGCQTRPSRKVSFKVPSGVKSGRVSTMTSPGGAPATGNFYWAGQAFSYANMGVGTKAQGQQQPYAVQAARGSVSVNVGASEAVLVDLK